MRLVQITDDVSVGEGRPLLVVAGPCVIEGRQLCMDVAGRLKELCAALGLPYVFKAVLRQGQPLQHLLASAVWGWRRASRYSARSGRRSACRC